MKSALRTATKTARQAQLRQKRQFTSTSPRSIFPSAASSSTASSSSNPDPSSSSDSKSKKDDPPKPPPEDNTVEGRSPFAAFVQVLREEVQKNREWQDSVKQLGGEVNKVQDSEAMKKTRELYERARLTASIKENPRLRKAAEELRKAGGHVGDAVGVALKGMEENAIFRGGRDALYRTATTLSTAALTASEPLRQTETYKAVAAEITEALDDAVTNVQHGGYIEKETRRRRREARLKKVGKRDMSARGKKVEEDVLAGQAVQLHATLNAPEKPSRLPQPISELLSNLQASYADSDNAFISSLRVVTSKVGRMFDETETSKVTRMIKDMDPSFNMEGFLRELREYIVPEVVDAFVNADQATLKKWCSEATFNVLMATLQQFVSPVLVSESRVLDIRNVDFARIKILEEENIPAFYVAWHTQEVLAYRDLKTGLIASGNEDKIELVGYVAVFTRIEEELDDEITGGWKIISMARRGS